VTWLTGLAQTCLYIKAHRECRTGKSRGFYLATVVDLEHRVHSRFVSISAIAVISFFSISWKTNANAADWLGGQEILIECPAWQWEPSPIVGVEYELCFDDIDHCTAAEIGDEVCIPSLGAHGVWVTAIDYQSGETIHYDGDIVSIERAENADFTGDGVVGMADLGPFVELFGDRSGSIADLDGDGIVGLQDFVLFRHAFGKCVSASGATYEQC
jgi:hypothetical protein